MTLHHTETGQSVVSSDVHGRTHNSEWNPERASRSRFQRIAFRAWAGILVAAFGIVLFGLVSLVLAWFQEVEGVAGPVTDLGYGVLVGIIQTTGLFVQLRSPDRKIAGVQQAFLVIPALAIGSAIASDSQNLVPALILLPALGLLLALHPAREEFFRRGAALSRTLLAITLIGAVPLVAYALDMGAQARDLAGPPHHVQRLSTMAAVAVAIVLTGLLAALRTRGWRIPAWSAGSAAIVFGLASVLFPDQAGSAGRGWGVVAIVGGVLFIAVAEWEARTPPAIVRYRHLQGASPGSRTFESCPRYLHWGGSATSDVQPTRSGQRKLWPRDLRIRADLT